MKSLSAKTHPLAEIASAADTATKDAKRPPAGTHQGPDLARSQGLGGNLQSLFLLSQNGSTRALEGSQRSAGSREPITCLKDVRFVTSHGASSIPDDDARIAALRNLFAEAAAASHINELSSIVDEVRVTDGHSSFYVTPDDRRVIAFSAALHAQGTVEAQLTEAIHEIAHAQLHDRHSRVRGQDYVDNYAVNERTTIRIARIRAKTHLGLKRGLSEREILQSLEHDDDHEQRLAIAGNRRSAVPTRTAGISRQWFSEPIDPSENDASANRFDREALQANKDVSRQLGAVFTRLCVSFTEKLEAVRSNRTSDENPYAPFDLQKVVKLSYSDELLDEGRSPLDVIPESVTGDDLRHALRYVEEIRTQFASRELEGPVAILPREIVDTAYLPMPGSSGSYATTGPQAIPVGEYGDEFTLDVIRAATILKNAATALIKDETTQLDRQRSSIIRRADLESSLPIFLDGIDSIADALVHALTIKNGGPDDPAQALRLVVEHKIPEELSLRLGFGLVAPTRRRNQVLKDIVVWANGKPRVNPDLKPLIRHQNNELTAAQMLSRPITGQGCPVGYVDKHANDVDRRSGVQMLSEIFLGVVENLAQRRASGTLVPITDVSAQTKPSGSRYSLISAEVTLDRLIRDYGSFRYSNSLLRERAEENVRALRDALNASPDEPMPEVRAQLSQALQDDDLARMEERIILIAGDLRSRMQQHVSGSLNDMIEAQGIDSLLQSLSSATETRLLDEMRMRLEALARKRDAINAQRDEPSPDDAQRDSDVAADRHSTGDTALPPPTGSGSMPVVSAHYFSPVSSSEPPLLPTAGTAPVSIPVWQSWHAPLPRGIPDATSGGMAYHGPEHSAGVARGFARNAVQIGRAAGGLPGRLADLDEDFFFRLGLAHDAHPGRTVGTPPRVDQTLDEHFDGISAELGFDEFQTLVARIVIAGTAHSPAEKAAAQWDQEIAKASAAGQIDAAEAAGLCALVEAIAMVDQTDAPASSTSYAELYRRHEGLVAEWAERDGAPRQAVSPSEVSAMLESGFIENVGSPAWRDEFAQKRRRLIDHGHIDTEVLDRLLDALPARETSMDTNPTSGPGWRATLAANHTVDRAIANGLVQDASTAIRFGQTLALAHALIARTPANDHDRDLLELYARYLDHLARGRVPAQFQRTMTFDESVGNLDQLVREWDSVRAAQARYATLADSERIGRNSPREANWQRLIDRSSVAAVVNAMLDEPDDPDEPDGPDDPGGAGRASPKSTGPLDPTGPSSGAAAPSPDGSDIPPSAIDHDLARSSPPRHATRPANGTSRSDLRGTSRPQTSVVPAKQTDRTGGHAPQAAEHAPDANAIADLHYGAVLTTDAMRELSERLIRLPPLPAVPYVVDKRRPQASHVPEAARRRVTPREIEPIAGRGAAALVGMERARQLQSEERAVARALLGLLHRTAWSLGASAEQLASGPEAGTPEIDRATGELRDLIKRHRDALADMFRRVQRDTGPERERKTVRSTAFDNAQPLTSAEVIAAITDGSPSFIDTLGGGVKAIGQASAAIAHALQENGSGEGDPLGVRPTRWPDGDASLPYEVVIGALGNLGALSLATLDRLRGGAYGRTERLTLAEGVLRNLDAMLRQAERYLSEREARGETPPAGGLFALNVADERRRLGAVRDRLADITAAARPNDRLHAMQVQEELRRYAFDVRETLIGAIRAHVDPNAFGEWNPDGLRAAGARLLRKLLPDALTRNRKQPLRDTKTSATGEVMGGQPQTYVQRNGRELSSTAELNYRIRGLILVIGDTAPRDHTVLSLLTKAHNLSSHLDVTSMSSLDRETMTANIRSALEEAAVWMDELRAEILLRAGSWQEHLTDVGHPRDHTEQMNERIRAAVAAVGQAQALVLGQMGRTKGHDLTEPIRLLREATDNLRQYCADPLGFGDPVTDEEARIVDGFADEVYDGISTRSARLE
jgi:hypothetical protein